MIPKRTDVEGRVKSSGQGLPYRPVVKTPPSTSRSMGSTHGPETKLPHTTGCGEKLKKKRSGVKSRLEMLLKSIQNI